MHYLSNDEIYRFDIIATTRSPNQSQVHTILMFTVPTIAREHLQQSS